jgi:hypothetical protein
MRSLAVLVVLAATGGACAPGSRGAGADGGDAIDAAPLADAPSVNDLFPAEPIFEPGAPANAPELFGPGGTGQPGGPCVLDPAPGALVPRNWLRLLVSFVPGSGQNLFEIRLHAPGVTHDLVVYTTEPSWKMTGALWRAMAQVLADQPVTVTVRGAVVAGQTLVSGPYVSEASVFTIAPVDAPGAIVYWTSSGGTALKGFTVGSETVHDVLRPADASTACVGCHASTPDGKFVGFSAASDPNGGNPATLQLRAVDGSLAEPDFLTADARALMARTTQQQPVFSPAHWTAGDRIALSSFEVAGRWELIWTDLEAASQAAGTGWGQLARTGDGDMAAAPAFSHDGETIAYTSAATLDGENAFMGGADVYTIPYAGGAGGSAAPLAGAADASFSEGYSAFSPDDAFIAFSRVPVAQTSVNNPQSEVLVVPAGGGSAVRIVGNDPPVCGGAASPGVTNGWPKWSPQVTQDGARTFYWLTFSSTRRQAGVPQLYVAGMVVENGAVTTYPAIYLWNQPETENNHTPAWDVFDIPID